MDGSQGFQDRMRLPYCGGWPRQPGLAAEPQSTTGTLRVRDLFPQVPHIGQEEGVGKSRGPQTRTTGGGFGDMAGRDGGVSVRG